jgi:uncharacterized cupredoxin-like copper-binding protein
MKRTLALALTVAAVLAAGCGSSSKSSSSSSSTPSTSTTAQAPPSSSAASGGSKASGALKLAADPGGALKFNKSSLTAKAGKVSISMTNPSSIPHGVSVEGNGVDKEGQVVNKGGTSTVSVALKPGKYTFYCPVPGHRQAGMEGSLTVK